MALIFSDMLFLRPFSSIELRRTRHGKYLMFKIAKINNRVKPDHFLLRTCKWSHESFFVLLDINDFFQGGNI